MQLWLQDTYLQLKFVIFYNIYKIRFNKNGSGSIDRQPFDRQDNRTTTKIPTGQSTDNQNTDKTINRQGQSVNNQNTDNNIICNNM